MSKYQPSDDNRQLKRLQIERKEVELAKLKGSLVSRAAVSAQFQENAALFRSVLVSFPSKIRQALRLTLDQQQEIEKVVDQTMEEVLANEMRRKGSPLAEAIAPVEESPLAEPPKQKRVRRAPASEAI